MATGKGLIHGLVISEQTKADPKTTIGDADEFCRSIKTCMMPSLVDIINQEKKMAATGRGAGGSMRNPDDGAMNWKSFKDRIRLRRTTAALSSTRLPSPKPSNNPGSIFSRTRTIAVRASDENSNNAGGGKMSLMALFEQGGGFGSSDEDVDYEREDEDDDVEEEEGVGVDSTCCVCMVRHKKGGASVPCGHTFCRLCSKEMSVRNGNCPLCIAFILEILNIW